MLIWKNYKEYKLEKYVIKNQKMNKITIETLDKKQKNRYITNKNKAREGQQGLKVRYTQNLIISNGEHIVDSNISFKYEIRRR